MMLSTTKIDDLDQWVKVFSTKGADKRRHYGSKGSAVYRDPNETDRIWVVFDWDTEGFKSFLADAEVPGIMKEAGHKVKPVPAELVGEFDA